MWHALRAKPLAKFLLPIPVVACGVFLTSELNTSPHSTNGEVCDNDPNIFGGQYPIEVSPTLSHQLLDRSYNFQKYVCKFECIN